MDRARGSGLATLLAQLGMDTRPVLSAVLIVAAFEATIVGLALAEGFGERALGVPPWVTLTVVWTIWTAWHSWWFPRRRLQYLERAKNPYRQAFIFDIYPWVSVGFSQMWRPLLNGETIGAALTGRFSLQPLPVMVGLGLCFVALAVIIGSIRTIGIDNAAFMREFVRVDSFVPIERGIYRVMMHPLFFAGIAYSCGLAIAVGTSTAWLLAGLNILYGLVYVRLENRRLRTIFGQPYERYRSRARRFTV